MIFGHLLVLARQMKAVLKHLMPKDTSNYAQYMASAIGALVMFENSLLEASRLCDSEQEIRRLFELEMMESDDHQTST